MTTLVLDFDGTVTTSDVGDDLCERFAPPSWRAIDERWVRGELSLPEAQRQMWALVRATREQALAAVGERARLRPGLDELLDGAAARGTPVWLASGGFDLYIDAVLGARQPRFARGYWNHLRCEGEQMAAEFPHPELACRRCGVCKGRVCDLARAAGGPVLFAGDGASDGCAIGRADRVFAVRGSRLARIAEAQGVDAVAFERLDELLPYL